MVSNDLVKVERRHLAQIEATDIHSWLNWWLCVGVLPAHLRTLCSHLRRLMESRLCHFLRVVNLTLHEYAAFERLCGIGIHHLQKSLALTLVVFNYEVTRNFLSKLLTICLLMLQNNKIAASLIWSLKVN